MPTRGLSLVGFLDPAAALAHLRNACVPAAGASDASLLADWQQAKQRLGAPPVRNPGTPRTTPLPAEAAAYATQLQELRWVNEIMHLFGATAQFMMVEVDALLAFQLAVDIDRSSHHCSGLSKPPTLDELLRLCLPQSTLPEPVHVTRGQSSMLIKARSLNMMARQEMVEDVQDRLVVTENGFFQPQGLAGIVVGASAPLVNVARWNERLYLSNGFHRVYGARIAGATEVPCLVRDVAHPSHAGILENGGTFSEARLTAPDPPTVAHFTQGRAFPVQIRRFVRLMNVSWSVCTVADE